MPLTSIEPPVLASSRMEEIRRRIRDRYYDRPEVRRVLSRLLLRRLAQQGGASRAGAPETA